MHRFVTKALASVVLLLLPLAPMAVGQVAEPGLEAQAAASAQREADYGHGIRIEGDEAFVKESVALLDRLSELPTGQRLLTELGETGKSTVITSTSDMNAYAFPLDWSKLSDASLGPEGKAGPGTDAGVEWNPQLAMAGFTPEVVMGHELIHALHIHRGELNLDEKQEGDNAGTRLEELRTIGTDGFEDQEVSENVLRREWNEAHPESPIPSARNGHGAADFAPEPAPQAQLPAPQGSSPAGTTTQPNYEGAVQALERALLGGSQ